MAVIERFARAYLHRVFADRPDLEAKVTPALHDRLQAHPDVQRLLPGAENDRRRRRHREDRARHAERSGDGRCVEHEVDTIIFGTGFSVGAGVGHSVPITGRDGVPLAGQDGRSAEAFLGTTFAGFPNLFVLVGPNTGLGHSSMVFMIESQLNYVLDALRPLDEHGAVALDTRRDRQDAYNAALQRRFDGSVWTAGGCASWYLDADGRNRTPVSGLQLRLTPLHPQG